MLRSKSINIKHNQVPNHFILHAIYPLNYFLNFCQINIYSLFRYQLNYYARQYNFFGLVFVLSG